MRSACLPSAAKGGTRSKKAISSSRAMRINNPFVPVLGSSLQLARAQAPAGIRQKMSGMGGCTSFSRHQLIAAGFGHQDCRGGGILFDLLPQAVNVGFQRMRGDAGIVTPHLLQQGL